MPTRRKLCNTLQYQKYQKTLKIQLDKRFAYGDRKEGKRVLSCIKFTIAFPACWQFLRGLRLNYAKCCWQLLHPQDIHIDSITTLSKSHTHTHTHSRLKRKSKQRKNNMLVIHEKDMDVKDTPMPKIEKKRGSRREMKQAN